MAKGKNKQFTKKGKKKVEKHAFLKKEWYKYMSPPAFHGSRPLGWTPANKTIGKKIGSDNVLGRVCEVSYADLDEKTRYHWRKVRMQVETVDGLNCYSSFYGLGCTRERIFSLIKKGQTLIKCWADVKTSDGYILRVFVTSCTNRKYSQVKSNCYAKSSQLRVIRKNVRKQLVGFASKKNVNAFANSVLSEELSKNLAKTISKTFPAKVVLVTKVKVLKKPQVDAGALVKEAQSTVHAAPKEDRTAKLIEDIEEEVKEEGEEKAEAGETEEVAEETTA